MATKIITAPTDEPITLDEAKDHLRVYIDDDDSVISEQITSARVWVEQYLGRALLTQTWEVYFNEFPACIEIPFPPLQSVTSIKYIDSDGVEQTLDAGEYNVHIQNEPGIIVLAYGKSWPSIRYELNAIAIRFVTGWATAADIPGPIKSAMLLLIGHLYEHREQATIGIQVNEIPFGIEALLFPYRMIKF